jgi:hypothetical protein
MLDACLFLYYNRKAVIIRTCDAYSKCTPLRVLPPTIYLVTLTLMY